MTATRATTRAKTLSLCPELLTPLNLTELVKRDNMPPDLVLVKWNDAYMESTVAPEDVATLTPAYKCETLGWLLNSDDRAVKVAGELVKDGDKITEYRAVTVIPTALVFHIESVEIIHRA